MRREFIRKMFRAASANTEAARNTYLDGLADSALSKQLNGKNLTGSSDKGTSAQYAMFAQWSPAQITDIVDFLRDYTGYSTAALAVAAFDAVPMSGVVNLVNRNAANWGPYQITP